MTMLHHRARYEVGVAALLLLSLGIWQIGAATLHRSAMSGATDVEIGNKIEPPRVVGTIQIPRLSVDAEILASAPRIGANPDAAYISGPSSLGIGSTTILIGGRNGIFQTIGSLEPGDTIILTTPEGGRHVYTVSDGKIAVSHVVGEAVEEGQRELALATRWPLDSATGDIVIATSPEP